jgi:hypothetical protein
MADSKKNPLAILKTLSKLDIILICVVAGTLIFAFVMLGMYHSEKTKNLYRSIYDNKSFEKSTTSNANDSSIEEMRSRINDLKASLSESNHRAEMAEEKATEAENLLNRGLESTNLVAKDGYLEKKGSSTPLKFHGSCTYSFNDESFSIRCDKVTNTNILNFDPSGDFSIVVYFCSGGPYDGGSIDGILMAEYPFESLLANHYYYDINKSAYLKNNPVSGYYYVTICVVELNSDGSSYITDYRNFPLQKWDHVK